MNLKHDYIGTGGAIDSIVICKRCFEVEAVSNFCTKDLPKCKVKIGSTYKYYKKEGTYIILSLGEVKINNLWQPSVNYSSGTKTYTRELAEFEVKFTEVL